MRAKIHNLDLRYIVDEYVPLDVVIELDNGTKISLTEIEKGICVNCEKQSTIELVAANSFLIKK